MPKVHDVKIWPEYFEDVESGVKPFDVRINDRDYKVGDTMDLGEWRPKTGHYTGRGTLKTITYVLPGGQFGVDDNVVVLGLAPFTDARKGIDHIDRHRAAVCSCGSVNFALLKSSGIECQGCQRVLDAAWSGRVSG